MNNRNKVILIIVAAAVFSLALTLVSVEGSIRMGPGRGIHRPMEGFIGMKMFFSTLNVILIGALLWSYTNVYREIPTRFTMSLIIFSIALLLYALMSNPLVHTVLGFRGSGLGPFAFIPDLFATVAVIVLLYQSYQ